MRIYQQWIHTSPRSGEVGRGSGRVGSFESRQFVTPWRESTLPGPESPILPQGGRAVFKCCERRCFRTATSPLGEQMSSLPAELSGGWWQSRSDAPGNRARQPDMQTEDAVAENNAKMESFTLHWGCAKRCHQPPVPNDLTARQTRIWER